VWGTRNSGGWRCPWVGCARRWVAARAESVYARRPAPSYPRPRRPGRLLSAVCCPLVVPTPAGKTTARHSPVGRSHLVSGPPRSRLAPPPRRMCSQERSCVPTGSPAGPDQRMKNRSLQTGRAYGLPSKTPPPPPDPTRWQGCRNGVATWRVSWPSSPARRLPGRARAELRSEAEPQPPIHRRRCAMPMGPHPQSGPHTPPAPTMRPSA